ncbi:class I SAM-dependent methyltransferase [Agriterribacter sp.]|uniref:class I SAM-dependent methyltransferase n=1 Tax=Agriterribacter sp. TaxID=2821509 RepID=UPI002BCE68CD|nr:methyltransferase domain-containing protein [Agriterribacter sp.]HTN07500.1 methyltransferase domain-containing protein [Agriterribacter sp.]
MNAQFLYDKDPLGSKTLETIAKASNFNQWMYSEIKPFLKGEILEIGSGIGNISQYAIADGFKITLSDFNAGYYQWLKEKFLNFPAVQNIVQIDLLHPDFQKKYSFLYEKFDSVFLLNVIEHIEDDITAVKNCKFLMKRNGHLILLAPAYKWLYCRFDRELGHYRRYTLHSMEQILRCNGLYIHSGNYFNAAGILGWLFSGKMMSKRMIGNDEMSVFNHIVPIARIIDKLTVKKIGLSVITKSIKQ